MKTQTIEELRELISIVAHATGRERAAVAFDFMIAIEADLPPFTALAQKYGWKGAQLPTQAAAPLTPTQPRHRTHRPPIDPTSPMHQPSLDTQAPTMEIDLGPTDMEREYEEEQREDAEAHELLEEPLEVEGLAALLQEREQAHFPCPSSSAGGGSAPSAIEPRIFVSASTLRRR